MSESLKNLVREAMLLGNHSLCTSTGHAWESEGGRGCLDCPRDGMASQAVYKCARCGIYDYGDKGGPGDSDCIDCERKEGKTRADVRREREAREAEEAAERQRVFAACQHRWLNYSCQDCGVAAPFGLAIPGDEE